MREKHVWSEKCLIVVLFFFQDEIPPYPLHFEVEWIKPLFMPSTVKFTTRKRADGNKINFELSTEDGQHVHLIGSVEHVPDLKLTKTETIA